MFEDVDYIKWRLPITSRVYAEAGAGFLPGFRCGPQDFVFVSVQRPRAAYLTNKSGADSGAANAHRDILHYLVGNFRLGLAVYFRINAGRDVVARANDYVEAGNPGDTGKGFRVAPNTVDSDINNCLTADFLKNHGLIDGFLLIQQAHIIQILIRMVAKPAEVIPVHRLISQSPVTGSFQFRENTFAVDKDNVRGVGERPRLGSQSLPARSALFPLSSISP